MSKETSERWRAAAGRARHGSEDDLLRRKLSDPHDEWDAELCVRILRSPAVHNLSAIRKRLGKCSRSWMLEFLELDGLGILLETLSRLNKIHGLAEVALQLECVACIRVVMNSRTGLTYIVEHARYCNKLVKALDTKNLAVKTQIFELLSALCTYSDRGHAAAFEALERYKTFKGYRYRFTVIIAELRKAEVNPYRMIIMAFINCLILGTEELQARIRLRDEFASLGLTEILEDLRVQEDDNLAVQCHVYDENRHKDDEAAEMLGLHFSGNHYDLFQTVFEKLHDSPLSLPLLLFLQNLTQLDPASPESDLLWELIEKASFRAVNGGLAQLQKSANFQVLMIQKRDESTQTPKLPRTVKKELPRETVSVQTQTDLVFHRPNSATFSFDSGDELFFDSHDFVMNDRLHEKLQSRLENDGIGKFINAGNGFQKRPFPHSSLPPPPNSSPPRPPTSAIETIVETDVGEVYNEQENTSVSCIPIPPPLPGLVVDNAAITNIPPPPPLEPLMPSTVNCSFPPPPPPPLPFSGSTEAQFIPPPPPLPFASSSSTSLPPLPPPLPCATMSGPLPPPPPPPPGFIQGNCSTPPPPPPPAMFGTLPSTPLQESQFVRSNYFQLGSIPPSLAATLAKSNPYATLPRPRHKMKTLNWTKVSSQVVDDSVWKSVHTEMSSHIHLDYDRVEELFCQKQAQEKAAANAKQKAKNEPSEICLLDAKRSLNINIFLKQFKCSLEELITMLKDGKRSQIGAERLRSMLKMLPEKEEIEMVKSFQGDKSKLGTAEKFILLISNLPAYVLRIEALLQMEEFTPSVEALKPQLAAVKATQDDLVSNKALKEFLALILHTGNFLNAGSYAGNAFGFRLNTLPKLYETRANKPRVTLLHFLVEAAERENASMLDFTTDFKHLAQVARVSVDGLVAEIKQLSDGINKLERQLKTVPEELKNYFSNFVKESQEEIKQLQGELADIQEQSNKLARHFCEEEKRFKLEDCFATFAGFCEKVKQARIENEQRKKQEERMALQKQNRAKQDAKKLLHRDSSQFLQEDVCLVDKLLNEIKRGSFKLRKTTVSN